MFPFMRRRPAAWIVLGVLLLIKVSVVVRFAKVQREKEGRALASQVQSAKPKVQSQSAALGSNSPSSISHVPSAEAVARAERILAERAKNVPKFKNRLSNTTASVGELTRKDHAILLENALFDTEKPVTPNIPNHLR